jgi:uncharacterized protein Yka (UPF0111/DUF47 family)
MTKETVVTTETRDKLLNAGTSYADILSGYGDQMKEDFERWAQLPTVAQDAVREMTDRISDLAVAAESVALDLVAKIRELED